MELVQMRLPWGRGNVWRAEVLTCYLFWPRFEIFEELNRRPTVCYGNALVKERPKIVAPLHDQLQSMSWDSIRLLLRVVAGQKLCASQVLGNLNTWGFNFIFAQRMLRDWKLIQISGHQLYLLHDWRAGTLAVFWKNWWHRLLWVLTILSHIDLIYLLQVGLTRWPLTHREFVRLFLQRWTRTISHFPTVLLQRTVWCLTAIFLYRAVSSLSAIWA